MDEKMTKMAEDLTQKSEAIREELVELERQFNVKKEEFLRIQGALEAIQQMSTGS